MKTNCGVASPGGSAGDCRCDVCTPWIGGVVQPGQTVTMEGTVTESSGGILRIFYDVKDDKGNVVNWKRDALAGGLRK
jgi:hypothetical protein